MPSARGLHVVVVDGYALRCIAPARRAIFLCRALGAVCGVYIRNTGRTGAVL
jgi:hypothetical protein